jgi:hypothetical protein
VGNSDHYYWSGWDTGGDVTPPEPGKEWLTIYEDGEEMAVIVLRTDAAIYTGDDEALASARQVRETRAQLIVDALNAFPVT